jgi:hypothetical protein
MKDIINIRPSSVGGFHDCQHRWFNIHILGVRSFSGYSAVRGTGVHKGAEQIWEESIKAGQKTFSINAAKDAAAQCVEDEFSSDDREIRLFDFETKEGAIDDATAGVEVYAKEIVTQVDIPVSVETYLKSEIDEGIRMSGTFDGFSADGTIRDIKTTSRKAVPQKYVDQMSIYARLAEVNGMNPNMKFSIENIVFMKDSIKAHLFTMDVNIEGARLKIDDIVSRIRWYKEHPSDGAMVFPANTSSYLCSDRYCPVFNSCYLRNSLPL